MSANKNMCYTTFSGVKIDPMNVNESDINIRDIARSLSMQCRYNGHIKDFYSVAEHSVMVANFAASDGQDPEIIKCCLMHDATEAYLQDIPTPIKCHLPDYMEWEQDLWELIANKYKLPLDLPEEVHYYDKKALFTEMPQLLQFPPDLDYSIYNVDCDNLYPLKNLQPREAELEFMSEWIDRFEY